MRLLGHTVLVVEDNFIIGEDIAGLIADEGGSVIGPVPSLAEAIDVVSRTPGIDVAVLDVRLGNSAVYPLAAILRRNDVPFVFYSGEAPGSLHPDYRAEPFIAKPSPSDALISGLAWELATRRA